MRDILFRGKRLDNGKWAEGHLVTLPQIPGFREAAKIMTWCKASPTKSTQEYDVFGVDIDTVGQFTGLRDKDGNRIFKGDIVDCNGHEQVVVWDYQYLNALDGRICGSDWTVRVVGNIHDKEGA